MRTAQLSWRALAGIGLCGAVVGFAIPAIASSLVRRERQQPNVRLLPAPKLPESEPQPSENGGETGPVIPPATIRARRLGAGKARRSGLRELERAQRGAAGQRVLAPAAGTSTPSEPSAPPRSDSPATKRHGGTSNAAPTRVSGGNGGSAPEKTSSGGSHAGTGSGK